MSKNHTVQFIDVKSSCRYTAVLLSSPFPRYYRVQSSSYRDITRAFFSLSAAINTAITAVLYCVIDPSPAFEQLRVMVMATCSLTHLFFRATLCIAYDMLWQDVCRFIGSSVRSSVNRL